MIYVYYHTVYDLVWVRLGLAESLNSCTVYLVKCYQNTLPSCVSSYRDQRIECKWPTGKRKCFFSPQIFRIVHCSFCVGCSWYFRLFSESEHGIETAKLNTMLGLHEQSERQHEASITWISKADGISPAFSRHRKQVLSEFLLHLKIMSLNLVITYYDISNWERRNKEIEGLEIKNITMSMLGYKLVKWSKKLSYSLFRKMYKM